MSYFFIDKTINEIGKNKKDKTAEMKGITT